MAGDPQTRVFAGALKHIFVDYVYRNLCKILGADLFPDQLGLQGGDLSWDQVESALEQAPFGAPVERSGFRCKTNAHRRLSFNACSPVDQFERDLPPGVFMPSKEFVRSKAPLREFGLALRHWEANCKDRALLPVVLDVQRGGVQDDVAAIRPARLLGRLGAAGACQSGRVGSRFEASQRLRKRAIW